MTFALSRLTDPEYFAEHRRPAHSDHRWYRSLDELAVGESGYEQSLNGVWKFHFARNPGDVIVGFEQPDVDTDHWDDIPVPAHIQLQGYDRPHYANVQYPWDGQEQIAPGQIPTRYNPVASYVRRFTLDRPVETGERIAIAVKGAESSIALWLNGTFIGFSADSFTPSEFDLTDALVDGENVLAAQVIKWSAGSWLEDQDFFRFSGIFRDVVLLRRPAAHVEDLRVTADLGADLSVADLTLAVDLVGEGSVELELEGVGPLEALGDGRFSIRLETPRLWSPEDPHLYRVLIRVLDGSGALTEVIAQPVGVRRFAIENGVLCLNGVRVVFFGVNRHEFGRNGRVMSREQTEADLRILKDVGVNAIRTSHYPNNSFFYELADEYGFLVIDEMNLETHGLWDRMRYLGAPVEDSVPGDKPEWRAAILDRATSLFERDKNHASVVIWSCGNESFGGSTLRDAAAYFRSVDVRPVHYEGVDWDPRYSETTDITSKMYTPAAQVEEYLLANRDKPFILCEYAHSMGNSFGAVDHYIELAYREPLFQGGFIWDFADQAIAKVDANGTRYFGYGGDHGDAPHDSDFSGNGIVFADRTPKPAMQELAVLYQPFVFTIDADGIQIVSRTLFTSSSAYLTTVTLRRYGRTVQVATLETAVAPGGTESYPLPVGIPQFAGEYTVDVAISRVGATRFSDAGQVIARGQGIVTVAGSGAGDAPAAQVAARPRLVHGTHNIGVHGPQFSVLYSSLHGGLQSYRFGQTANGGRDLLRSIPKPNFWHAPTSNEQGWGGPFEDGQWLLASRYARTVGEALHNTRVSTDDDAVTVGYTYALPTSPASTCDVDYRVTGDGRVEVTLTMDVSNKLPDLPEFGMLFTTDASLHRLRWYGDGPDETAVDRRRGARRDVFEREVAGELAPYLRPQESGNRTGVRWATVTDDRGWGLKFDDAGAADGMEFSALPWTPFEIENADHPNELPPIVRTVLRPALQRRGVGGDDSWGARTLPNYRIQRPEGHLRFRFGFQGVAEVR